MAGIPILHFKYNDKLENTKGQAVIIYFHGGGWEWFDAGKQFAVCIIHVRPITNSIGISPVIALLIKVVC